MYLNFYTYSISQTHRKHKHMFFFVWIDAFISVIEVIELPRIPAYLPKFYTQYIFKPTLQQEHFPNRYVSEQTIVLGAFMINKNRNHQENLYFKAFFGGYYFTLDINTTVSTWLDCSDLMSAAIFVPKYKGINQGVLLLKGTYRRKWFFL